MDIDIVIAIYGGADHVARCVNTLQTTLPQDDTGIKVFLIDDATPPEKGAKDIAQIFASAPPHWRAERLYQNRGFAGANNYGVSLGSAEYVALLNSDTEAQPRWLEHMAAVLDSNPNVALVGAKLIFPPWLKDDPARPGGRIQHAGVVFNVDRNPYHIFLGWNPEHKKVNRPLLFKAVTGACWLIRRSVYEELGGLDEAFRQGNYEDVQMCLQITLDKGYDIAYCPKASLYHYASGSGNVNDVQANAMLFRSRWYERIEPDDHTYW